MEKQATATMLQSVSWSIFPLGLDRNGVYTLWQAVKAPDCDHQYSKHCTMHTHLSPVITETNTKQFHFHFYHKLLRNSQFLPHDTDAVHKAQCKICDGFVPICLSVQQCCYCIGTAEPIIKQSMLDSSPRTSFSRQTFWWNSSAKYWYGRKNCYFQPISHYTSKMIQTGTQLWRKANGAFAICRVYHFRWPWMTNNH